MLISQEEKDWVDCLKIFVSKLLINMGYWIIWVITIIFSATELKCSLGAENALNAML